MSFKTTLFKAAEAADELTAGYVGEHFGFDVDDVTWFPESPGGETIEFRMNGGDDRIEAHDQKTEIDANGRAEATTIDGEKFWVRFECVARRALIKDDL